MELCILKFDGSHAAQHILAEVLDAEGDRNQWLFEVGTVSRPLVGRVRVGATFPDGQSKTFHEGDLADAAEDLGGYTGYYVSALAGPFGSMFASVDAALSARAYASEAEQRLFHLDEVKKVLPRDSSALVLIANPETCDAMVAMFQAYSPKVIRRDIGEELRKRLQTLQLKLTQSAAAQDKGASASP